MEIKTVGDLIPYRKSLQELWDREEFQPVLKILNALRNEAISEIKTLELTESFAVAIRASVARTKLNMADLIINMPTMIKAVEDQQEKISNKITEMKKAQEGGSI